MILSPTRELALQITQVLKDLMHFPKEFKVITVYGGARISVREQANDLKRGTDFFVGTTGRVLDHINRGNVDFGGLKSIILDEADVMLNMGFKEDVDNILTAAK